MWTEWAFTRRTRNGFDSAGFQRSDECDRNGRGNTRTLRLLRRRCEHWDVCSDWNLDGAEESRRFWYGTIRGCRHARFHDLLDTSNFMIYLGSESVPEPLG